VRDADGHVLPEAIDRGASSSDYALQTMKDVPYDKWRQYDPEDTVSTRCACTRLA
jgi:hypothetical protein